MNTDKLKSLFRMSYLVLKLLFYVAEIIMIVGFTALILCYVLFGGEISIQINFHSGIDLWNSVHSLIIK